jgi:phosphopantetheinyl transferase
VIVRVCVVACDAALTGREKVLDQRAAAARALAALGLVDPPRVPDGPPLPANGTYWSASHTQGAAGAAVAPFPVGFDLERERDLRPALVERFLSADEPRIEPLVAWTAKEAVLKKLGIGIAGLSRCRILEQAEFRVKLDFDGVLHHAYVCRHHDMIGTLTHAGPLDTGLRWEWPA